jgi:hypothetical protein
MNNTRIGNIGEQMVIVKLMELGWDAFNVNQVFKNYKSVDIICMNPSNGQTQQIQVKTGRGNNPFPTGFYSDNKGNINDFEIKGPWVFVLATGEGIDMSFRFFILSKSEVEALIRTSNNWYMNEYVRENEISNHTPVGIKLKWLQGEGEKDTLSDNLKIRHAAYVNPLQHNSENCWNKIWED